MINCQFNKRIRHHVISHVTCGPCEIFEGVDALLAVVAGRGDSGDVPPPECLDHVEHCLGLVRVRRDHAKEVVESGLVTQLRTRRSITHLGNL